MFGHQIIFVPVSCFCGFPGAPAHSEVQFNTERAPPGSARENEWRAGTVARYNCDRGFELLGPARRICGANGTWTPQGIPFCGKTEISYYLLINSKIISLKGI